MSVVCSLLATCKAHEVNPRNYLNDVIARMPYMQKASYDGKPPIKDIYEASGAVATFASKAQSYDDKGRGRSSNSLLRREQD